MRGDFNVVSAPEMARVQVPSRPAQVAAFNPGPDPWSQPVGTGNGISNGMASRKSAFGQTPLLAAASPSKEYTFGTNIEPDGPDDIRMDVRREADYRQSVRNLGRVRGYGRNAAIAGGAVAGLAGLDALIGGERDNRDQEVYQ